MKVLFFILIPIIIFSCNAAKDYNFEDYSFGDNFHADVYGNPSNKKVEDAIFNLKNYVKGLNVSNGYDKFYFSFIWRNDASSPIYHFIEIMKDSLSEYRGKMYLVEYYNKKPIFYKEENIKPKNSWDSLFDKLLKLNIHKISNVTPEENFHKNIADGIGITVEFSNKHLYKIFSRILEIDDNRIKYNNEINDCLVYLKNEFKFYSAKEIKSIFMKDTLYPSVGIFKRDSILNH